MSQASIADPIVVGSPEWRELVEEAAGSAHALFLANTAEPSAGTEQIVQGSAAWRVLRLGNRGNT